MTTPLHIGLALDLGEGAPGLWDGDALQAASFLAMVLSKSPLVARCVAFDGHQAQEPDPAAVRARSPLPVVTRGEAMEQLDLVIEVGLRLPEDWTAAFAARGGALVAQRLSSDLVADGESMIFNCPAGALPAPNAYREIWVWPAYAASSGSYHHYTGLALVHVVPQLWSPLLVDHAAAAMGADWHYQPGRKAWRLAVMEPNRSSVAACMMPMILCDEAFRRQPAMIEGVTVSHAQALVQSHHFNHFAQSLELTRQGRAMFLDAAAPFAVLGVRADALVSHHWGSAQSYRHYEALHGGYPLIHNNVWLGDCGYRYGDFDPEGGALGLLAALLRHDDGLAAYRAAAGDLLAGLDPHAPRQVEAYEERLRALFPAG